MILFCNLVFYIPRLINTVLLSSSQPTVTPSDSAINLNGTRVLSFIIHDFASRETVLPFTVAIALPIGISIFELFFSITAVYRS